MTRKRKRQGLPKTSTSMRRHSANHPGIPATQSSKVRPSTPRMRPKKEEPSPPTTPSQPSSADSSTPTTGPNDDSPSSPTMYFRRTDFHATAKAEPTLQRIPSKAVSFTQTTYPRKEECEKPDEPELTLRGMPIRIWHKIFALVIPANVSINIRGEVRQDDDSGNCYLHVDESVPDPAQNIVFQSLTQGDVLGPNSAHIVWSWLLQESTMRLSLESGAQHHAKHLLNHLWLLEQCYGIKPRRLEVLIPGHEWENHEIGHEWDDEGPSFPKQPNRDREATTDSIKKCLLPASRLIQSIVADKEAYYDLELLTIVVERTGFHSRYWLGVEDCISILWRETQLGSRRRLGFVMNDIRDNLPLVHFAVVVRFSQSNKPADKDHIDQDITDLWSQDNRYDASECASAARDEEYEDEEELLSWYKDQRVEHHHSKMKWNLDCHEAGFLRAFRRWCIQWELWEYIT